MLGRVARVQQDHPQPVASAAHHSDEAAPGFLGVARLQPDRPRIAQPDQRVVAARNSLPPLIGKRSSTWLPAHDPPDPGLGHRQPGQHRQVARRRSGCPPPDRARRRSACRSSPHLRARSVHQPHEAVLVARHVHRERDRRVVPRHDQQSVQQRLGPHAAALRQHPDAGPLVVERRLRDPHRLVRPGAVDHDQRGHDLRQARDRQHARRVVAPEHIAAVDVEHQPRARRLAQRQVEGVDSVERDVGHRLAPVFGRRRRLCGTGSVCAAIGSLGAPPPASSEAKAR